MINVILPMDFLDNYKHAICYDQEIFKNEKCK
jgi:hypothetical protein